jgi:hypothetical protein
MRYIQQLTDVTKYDSMLTLAMTSGMKAVLAYPITKSATRQQDASIKLHEFHLKQARTVDGMEGTGERAGGLRPSSRRAGARRWPASTRSRRTSPRASSRPG